MSVTINGTSGVTTPGIANSEGYTGDGLTIAAGAPAGAVTINSTYQTFSPNGSEAMRLDASGNLLVGTTTASGIGYTLLKDPAGITTVSNTTFGGGFSHNIFKYNGTQVGGITTTTTTTTSFNTSSDYRLKENVAPLTNALDKIASLKPCTFTWKADGSADRGFIAHELQEVIPQAVSGEKDAVDAEGNIMPQGVDYGKITPEIVAAIQELKARIEQLETK